MASLNRIGSIHCSNSSSPGDQLHSRQHDIDDYNRIDNQRNDCNRTLWRRLSQLVGFQRNSQWRSQRGDHNILTDNRWGSVPIGDCRTGCWNYRTGNHYENSRAKLGQKLAVGLLPVIFFLPVGVKAQLSQENTTAVANPVATSNGSVSNQAVQINQGGYSKQGFAPGHFCNSSTLTFTPFYLGNDVYPEYVRNQNFGLQATLSFPLDGGMVETCKALAKKRLEKERLDYALIRALKCAELLEKGFMFRPDSPYSVTCADVVPIARAPRTSPPPVDAVTSR